jgi:endonuclease III
MVAVEAGTILEILQRSLALPALVKSKGDPFETLIVTIISQNTADRNTAVAFNNLSKRFEITPEALAKANATEIEECIKVAGLYKAKTHAIQSASKIILEKFGGSLNPILALSLEEARKTLMDMPGVGPKTADVVLLFSAGMPTIPVDTHVNRVSKRLLSVPTDGDYGAVRSSLQSMFPPKDYLSIHLLLIAHGRQYCKARKPLCQKCPVNIYCPTKGSLQP